MDAGTEAGVAFRALAEAYCEVIESLPAVDPDAVVDRIRDLLAHLVAAALDLPNVDPETDDDVPPIRDAAWTERFCAIAAGLSAADSYWTISDAYADGEPEPLLWTLADDLADIWRDLKAPLLALDAGTQLVDAVWEWRFGFHSHWGARAVEALRALHHWTTKHREP